MREGLVTFGNTAEAEYTEKKSVFIGYAASVKSAEAAEAFIDEIRKRNADARHHVFA